MNYIKQNIKPGITFHKINTNKFKTNLFSIFITTKLERENVTKNALLTAILRRGTKKMPTQELISQNLENMYGASFDCGVEKTGDNHIMKFYLESINNEFLPSQENLSKECLDILIDIVFNPYVENGSFKEEYINGEKENLKQIIEGKIDNKAKYASDRCIEEMYKDKPYGLYKYGYIEDLKNINAKDLYEYYLQLIKNAKIDIFVSGDLDNEILNSIKENEIIKNLNERDPKYATSVYNIILGGSANSKMFQNVREKASLAYTAGSIYLRQKDNVFIKCGIDIPNYDKALEIIKQQLEQMKNGDFSEDDINNAKLLISSTIGSIPETQDAELTYYFSQELSDEFISIEDYINRINSVTKEQILNIANNVQINTIYFLKD